DDHTTASDDHTVVAPLAAAAAAEPESFARSERRWMVPAVLILVIGLALTLAGVLIGRTETGQQIIDRARQVVTQSDSGSDSSSAVDELSIVGAQTFDPDGDGTEEDAIVDLAVDGNPDTEWHT